MQYSEDAASKIGEAARLGNGQPGQADRLACQNLLYQGHTNTRKALLDRYAGGCVALERHAFGEDVARDGRREEPLFVGEPGIDRRLSERAATAISSMLAPSNP